MIIEPAWDRSGEYWACAQEGAFIFALSYITVVHDYCVVSVSLCLLWSRHVCGSPSVTAGYAVSVLSRVDNNILVV